MASPHVDRDVTRCYGPYLAPGTEECDGYGPRASSPYLGAFVAAIVQFPDEADCKIRVQGRYHRFSDPLLLVIGPFEDMVELQGAQALPAQGSSEGLGQAAERAGCTERSDEGRIPRRVECVERLSGLRDPGRAGRIERCPVGACGHVIPPMFSVAVSHLTR